LGSCPRVDSKIKIEVLKLKLVSRTGLGWHKHFEILVEDAVKESELVIAPDGVAGNLMFRTLHFVGDRKAYGAPVVNIPKVFVDTSRGKADFSDAVRLAAGLFQAQAGRL
jgi:predicted methyltransferase MtxX (methanogen marker protein 4)